MLGPEHCCPAWRRLLGWADNHCDGFRPSLTGCVASGNGPVYGGWAAPPSEVVAGSRRHSGGNSFRRPRGIHVKVLHPARRGSMEGRVCTRFCTRFRERPSQRCNTGAGEAAWDSHCAQYPNIWHAAMPDATNCCHVARVPAGLSESSRHAGCCGRVRAILPKRSASVPAVLRRENAAAGGLRCSCLDTLCGAARIHKVVSQ